MKPAKPGLPPLNAARAASIHARLLNRAKKRDEDFNLLLTRYATERLLYRLSISPERDQFLLKGALLFDLWFDVPHRPTHDADFLGFGSADSAMLAATVRLVCAIDSDDGMCFDTDSVVVTEIREETSYGGLRVKLKGFLGNANCTLQLDVGYGDAAPSETGLPTLLDGVPAPRLRVYPRETVVAEKLEAIASMGLGNSRMKDYFDLRALLREDRLEPRLLVQAIAATFSRRRTPLPDGLPLGLTSEFSRDGRKTQQWNSFLAKNKLKAPPLEQVVTEVADGLAAPLRQALELLGATR